MCDYKYYSTVAMDFLHVLAGVFSLDLYERMENDYTALVHLQEDIDGIGFTS